jgi:multimeric flavodoxin WrbA
MSKRKPSKLKVPDILNAQIATFIERNTQYGDNWENMGKIVSGLFPNGVDLRTADDFVKWHLFEWAIGKLSRFANSGMTHLDSLHDAAVYITMVEAFMGYKNERQGTASVGTSSRAKNASRRKTMDVAKNSSNDGRR